MRTRVSLPKSQVQGQPEAAAGEVISIINGEKLPFFPLLQNGGFGDVLSAGNIQHLYRGLGADDYRRVVRGEAENLSLAPPFAAGGQVPHDPLSRGASHQGIAFPVGKRVNKVAAVG